MNVTRFKRLRWGATWGFTPYIGFLFLPFLAGFGRATGRKTATPAVSVRPGGSGEIIKWITAAEDRVPVPGKVK